MTKIEAPLTEKSLAAYRREGYVAFEGVLSRAEVDQAREALATVIHGMHQAALSRSPDVKLETADVESAGDLAYETGTVRLVVPCTARTDTPGMRAWLSERTRPARRPG